METPSCPRCASRWVTPGRFGNALFNPVGLRFLAYVQGVVMAGRGSRTTGFGCLGCGLLWSEGDPAALRALLEKSGTESTRRWMEEAKPEKGAPARKLPST